MAQGSSVESSVTDPAELPDFVTRPARAQAEEAGDEEHPDDAADAAIEARAREMGWKPLAEYRGPPGKWQDAKSFVERGETILPILRAENRKFGEKFMRMEGEITGLRTTIASLKNTSEEQLKIIKDLRDMGARADQRGYERAMAEIKTAQRQAVQAGDTERYDQLVEQAEALAESRTAAARPSADPPPARTEPPTPPAPQLSAATQAFIAENPWFKTDKLLSDTMVAFHQEILQERQASQAVLNANPELDRDLLEEAKRRVVERYPERFGEAPARRETPAPRPARRAAAVATPTVESPAARPGSVPATINTIQDPAERTQAREAFARMKRQMPDFTEADYMAIYADPHGDVLSMQQKPRREANGR